MWPCKWPVVPWLRTTQQAAGPRFNHTQQPAHRPGCGPQALRLRSGLGPHPASPEERLPGGRHGTRGERSKKWTLRQRPPHAVAARRRPARCACCVHPQLLPLHGRVLRWCGCCCVSHQAACMMCFHAVLTTPGAMLLPCTHHNVDPHTPHLFVPQTILPRTCA
jgi:hypothetical protein